MVRPQHLRGSLGGFIYNMKKKRFDPIFGLCMMCDAITFQILPILDGMCAGVACPHHLRRSLGGFFYNME